MEQNIEVKNTHSYEATDLIEKIKKEKVIFIVDYLGLEHNKTCLRNIFGDQRTPKKRVPFTVTLAEN